MFSIIQKLHKTRSHYWCFLQQKQYFSLKRELRLALVFLVSWQHMGWKRSRVVPARLLPAQSGFVAADLYCPTHFMMYKLTRLMAQEKPPFLWSNLSNSQYISIWETTASKGHTNFKEALLRLRRERNKALLECRKVTCNNYTFHEWTQQFSMVKRARPFSLRKMAQFGTIPPETGTHDTPLHCWSTRLGLENCAASPTALSWQTWRLGTHPVQDSSSPFPSARQPSSSPRTPPDQLPTASSTVTQKASSRLWF